MYCQTVKRISYAIVMLFGLLRLPGRSRDKRHLRPPFFSLFLLLGGCAGNAILEPCTIDASGQQKAMENFAEALRNDGRVDADSYIEEPFKPRTVYNGKDHCDFIVQPWRPVQTHMMWDGTIGARVDKQTLEVTDLYRIDEK